MSLPAIDGRASFYCAGCQRIVTHRRGGKTTWRKVRSRGELRGRTGKTPLFCGKHCRDERDARQRQMEKQAVETLMGGVQDEFSRRIYEAIEDLMDVGSRRTGLVEMLYGQGSSTSSAAPAGPAADTTTPGSR